MKDRGRGTAPADPADRAMAQAEQLAVAAYQLLAMLDVVREWTPSDANSAADLADEAEAIAFRITGAAAAAPAGQLARLLKTLDAALLRAEYLASLAPVQLRDDAASASMAKVLRRLAQACEALRRVLAPAQAGTGDATA